MNIIEAIKDPELFRPFLADRDDSLASWFGWMSALRAIYGLPIPKKQRELFEQISGRSVDKLPGDGFRTALFLTGRRSGKSRTAAVIGAFESVLAGHEHRSAKGERPLVAIVSPTRAQSRVVKEYIEAIFDTDLLRPQVLNPTRTGFELRNGVRIEILAGSFATVRGYTLAACICDEVAFFGLDDDAKIKSDTALVQALQPALATTNGKLIAISSPYARKGWCWKTYQKHFGNDTGRILVLNAPSRVMHPLLPQSVIDEAMAEDLASAKSEYMGEFRDDVLAFIPREVVESLVVPGRTELFPERDRRYVAFCDVSGGRADDAALAIAHKSGRMVIIDKLATWRPPFNPYEVIRQMAEEIKRWSIKKVVGDNYSAEFVARAFEQCGIRYELSEKNKSQLYLELLPRLTSGEIELLDNEQLVNQLASLERRTRSGGRDVVDHPPNAHDDASNSVAGAAVTAFTRVIRVGAL